MSIIATLIIGAIAGWLGGTIYKGSGLGLVGNIIIGLLGSGLGYWLLGSVFNISLGEGWVGSILTGAIGAIIILFLMNLIFKKKSKQRGVFVCIFQAFHLLHKTKPLRHIMP